MSDINKEGWKRFKEAQAQGVSPGFSIHHLTASGRKHLRIGAYRLGGGAVVGTLLGLMTKPYLDLDDPNAVVRTRMSMLACYDIDAVSNLRVCLAADAAQAKMFGGRGQGWPREVDNEKLARFLADIGVPDDRHADYECAMKAQVQELLDVDPVWACVVKVAEDLYAGCETTDGGWAHFCTDGEISDWVVEALQSATEADRGEIQRLLGPLEMGMCAVA